MLPAGTAAQERPAHLGADDADVQGLAGRVLAVVVDYALVGRRKEGEGGLRPVETVWGGECCIPFLIFWVRCWLLRANHDAGLLGIAGGARGSGEGALVVQSASAS